MSNLGFYWKFNLPGNFGSQRTPGGCASMYTPVEEKYGFWANNGTNFIYALVCFAVCCFVLIYGWNNGLALGGPCYYTFAAAAPVLWGLYAIHIVRQHRLINRVVGEDDDSSTIVASRAESIDIDAQVEHVLPGEKVEIVYGLWGESERHSVEMEHRGGDHFTGSINVGTALGSLDDGIVHYHINHHGREHSSESNATCLIVRASD